jgi:UPF0755 protein
VGDHHAVEGAEVFDDRYVFKASSGENARYGRPLRRADLESDSPYNTYVRAGLPPTPIAAPGAEALRATTNPPTSRALYFVAKGDGTSEFSDNLDDHNRAVNRYQRR